MNVVPYNKQGWFLKEYPLDALLQDIGEYLRKIYCGSMDKPSVEVVCYFSSMARIRYGNHIKSIDGESFDLLLSTVYNKPGFVMVKVDSTDSIILRDTFACDAHGVRVISKLPELDPDDDVISLSKAQVDALRAGMVLKLEMFTRSVYVKKDNPND